jgi:hypothetical protein
MHSRPTAFNTAFAAVLMLLYGWLAGLEGVSNNEIYNAAVDAFKWTLRLGGIAMLLAAIVCFAGLRIGLLLDALASAGSGAVMLVCVGIWFSQGSGFDLQDVVILLFSLLLIREAWISFRLFSDTAAATEATTIHAEPIVPHPASVHPPSLPSEGEPPPPEGYLSALAKEKDEPPTASYE